MKEGPQQDPRTHAVTLREARKLINRNFTELSDVRLAQGQKDPMKGMDNVAYRMENGYFVRFTRNAEASDQAEREIRLLPVLRKHVSIPIPDIEYAALQPNGNYFFAYMGIEGGELTRQILESLSAEKYAKIVADLAGFIQELRSFPEEEVRKAHVIDEVPAVFLQNVIRKLEKSEPNDLDEAERGEIKRIFDRFLRAEEGDLSWRPCLIHGDLGEPHIRYDVGENKITGIIDWGDVRFADPALEIQSLHQEYEEKFVRDILVKLGTDVEGELYRARIYTLARSVNRYLRRIKSDIEEEKQRAPRNLRSVRREMLKLK